MSDLWSMQAQNGSLYGGAGGPNGQPPVAGGVSQRDFDVQNVNYDASITPKAAARRKRQKKTRLAADVNRHLSYLSTNGQQQQQYQPQHQQPQGQYTGAWQAPPPPPPPQYPQDPQDFAGLGTQFGGPAS